MRRAAIAGALALYAFFVVCSWTGIDFGGHWDEIPHFIKPAANAMRSGTLLPGRYIYPSLLHDITLATAAVTQEDIESKPFLLNMRRIVAAISGLTIIWIFLLVLVWRRSPMEALFAAAITAGSWELEYHSRWLAVDPLMVQFAALTLLCAVAGHTKQSPWLLRGSAIAAGLACGSKYTAGLLLVTTVLAACWFSRERWRRILEAPVLFAIAFLVTTPGAILHIRQFLADQLFNVRVYSGGWDVYTVNAPFEHARLMADYIGFVILSHTPLIAIFLVAIAIGGAIVVARADRRVAIIVLSFPVAYLLYFATQRVMVARNVLVVIPFLAPLAAIGIGAVLKRSLVLRRVVVAGVAAMLLINLAWLWTAARSIRRSPGVYLAQLVEYLDANSHRRFALSPGVVEQLRAFDGRERAATNPKAADAFVFFALESPSVPFLANRRDSVERWFGAHEVNFNYYPTWVTADRILVMEPRKVRWLRHAEPRSGEASPARRLFAVFAAQSDDWLADR